MKNNRLKFTTEEGHTLVESLVGLVLLTGILMPLIWLFGGQSSEFQWEKDLEMDRAMYNILFYSEGVPDSVHIGKKSYPITFEENGGFITLTVRNKGVLLYEKTLAK